MKISGLLSLLAILCLSVGCEQPRREAPPAQPEVKQETPPANETPRTDTGTLPRTDAPQDTTPPVNGD